MRIRRDWLRRIPDYDGPWSRRKGWRPDPGGEPGPGPGEPDDDGEPQADEVGGEPVAADPPPGDDDEAAETAPGDDGDEQGEPDGDDEADAAGQGEGEPAEGEPEPGEAQEAHDGTDEPHPEAQTRPGAGGEREAPPELDTSLYLPEEEEQARREAEQRKQRTPWNRGRAPKAFDLEGRYLRGLAARFARMVSKLAEDNAELPSEGDDEWDINELVRRRFTGRMLSQCRMSREKRRVAVVLDTSPSCAHQARLFGAVAQVAEALGDCEMYDGPNFQLVARWQRGRWEELPPEERGWFFRHRVVLAFGDFDGIEHITRASWERGNRIYWFCCEERPMVLEANRDYFTRQYKGHYQAAYDLQGLMRAMARVR